VTWALASRLRKTAMHRARRNEKCVMSGPLNLRFENSLTIHVVEADRQARVLLRPIERDGNESTLQPQEAMILGVVLLFLDGMGIGYGAAAELPQTRFRIYRVILPMPVA